MDEQQENSRQVLVPESRVLYGVAGSAYGAQWQPRVYPLPVFQCAEIADCTPDAQRRAQDRTTEVAVRWVQFCHLGGAIVGAALFVVGLVILHVATTTPSGSGVKARDIPGSPEQGVLIPGASGLGNALQPGESAPASLADDYGASSRRPGHWSGPLLLGRTSRVVKWREKADENRLAARAIRPGKVHHGAVHPTGRRLVEDPAPVSAADEGQEWYKQIVNRRLTDEVGRR